MTRPSTAMERAIVEQPEVSAFWIDSVRCRVFGRTGNRYTVRARPDGTFSCDCKGAEYGRACWHVEAAKLRPRPANAEVALPAAVVTAVTDAVQRYVGENQYLHDLQAQLHYTVLSPGQAATAAEILAAGDAPAEPETVDLAPTAEPAPIRPKLRNGYYAVPLVQEGVQFFRVSWHWDPVESAQGTQVVAAGLPNGQFESIAFLRADRLAIWRRFRDSTPNAIYQAFAILIGSQTPLESMRRFTRLRNCCAICGELFIYAEGAAPWHQSCAPA